jgi:hypothetical protein
MLLLFDIVMGVVFSTIAWRTCAALTRERAIMREFGLSLNLVPVVLLYPVMQLVVLCAGWMSGNPLVRDATWALCAMPYAAAWWIARSQAETLHRAGTSRTAVALEAVANAHGFAMLGLALVIVRAAIVYLVGTIHAV